MAITIYKQEDFIEDDFLPLRFSVLGYGNQGSAHAHNLRDSGHVVKIGQRKGANFERAIADGFAPVDVSEAVENVDVIIVALPDESAAEIYNNDIASLISPGQALGFIHGFNIHYRFLVPSDEIDVIMVAPKGPGTLVRSLYTDGRGVPSLFSVHRDASGNARKKTLTWARGIGSLRSGIIETTFAHETETDLFGEQAVLCGGVSALTKAAFETMVEAGYEPEFAYLECVHELKQVVDLIYHYGLSGMRERISNTAEYGDLTRGERIISEHARNEMKQVLSEIKDGTFAHEWINECKNGKKNFKALFENDVDTPYEKAGEVIRSLMPWLNR